MAIQPEVTAGGSRQRVLVLALAGVLLLVLVGLLARPLLLGGSAAPKASTDQPELAEIATGINVKGGYFQIEDFLSRVENLVKGADPQRVPPRSVLVQSVSVSSSTDSGTGDSAAATPDASTASGDLQAAVALTVFQLAGSPAAPAPATGAGTAGATQVR